MALNAWKNLITSLAFISRLRLDSRYRVSATMGTGVAFGSRSILDVVKFVVSDTHRSIGQ